MRVTQLNVRHYIITMHIIKYIKRELLYYYNARYKIQLSTRYYIITVPLACRR